MKIGEIVSRTGLSSATIRFYERSGLCPGICRGRDGQRRFSPADLDWFLLLASLRETGMPLAEMRAFAALYAQGDTTIPQRKAALLAHHDRLAAQEEKLKKCRGILSRKLKKYDEISGECT